MSLMFSFSTKIRKRKLCERHKQSFKKKTKGLLLNFLFKIYHMLSPSMLRSSIDYARPFCLENCCCNFLSHLMLSKALGVRYCFLLCMSLPTKFQKLKVSLTMEPKTSYIYSTNKDMFTTTRLRSKRLENLVGNIKKSKQ
jgi:hypothetical protein